MGEVSNSIYAYAFIPIISLIGHSYYQQFRFSQINHSGLPMITTFFALLSALYVIGMGSYGDKEEFHEGREKYRRMWRW